MKRFFDFFLSSKATVIFLILIGVAMAAATFIEDKYDTVTARVLIYNTTWFELLFILLIINLIGHIKTYKLLSRKKLGGLIFHLAFVVMIIGAGITRYFGFEGSMHIRKGEASNIVYTADPYLAISYNDGKTTIDKSYPISIGAITKNSFHLSIPTESKGNIDISYKEVVPNAVAELHENVSGGKNMIEISLASAQGMQTVIISSGEAKNLGQIVLAFNNNTNKDAVKVTEKGGSLSIVSPYEMVQSVMGDSLPDSIAKNTEVVFSENNLYGINGLTFFFSKYYKSAQRKVVTAGDMKQGGVDAVILDVSVNGKQYQADVFNTSSDAADMEEFTYEGQTIKFGFGNKSIELPFSLYLKDFILEKYPGSESPSSYKSEVVLIDKKNNVNEDRSIFMNNVLDYKQYRFFQSSYDTDGQGTILSVNHDFWGTMTSYLGYSLLVIGFLITLFNKNSRFLSLRKFIADGRSQRKGLSIMILFMLGFSAVVSAQSTSSAVVDSKHAEKFGHLLTQTYDGRFAPANTLALDVMHKVCKRENFNFAGKGKMNAMQAFLDMMAEPEFWQQQKIIYVPRQEIRDIIGIKTEYAAFIDFFDQGSQYKLGKIIDESFRKKQSEKNKFDKEILKVDERLNIFYMILNGNILKIFPEQNSKNNKWVSIGDEAAMIPLSGAISIINDDLQLRQFNYANIMQAYIFEVRQAMKTGDYSKADKIIGYISEIQKQGSDASILPSETKINAEVFYNKADIFVFLRNVYATLSTILLILAFIENIKAKRSKLIGYVLNILTITLVIAFLYHTLGMGLRWYITGHAPWSNGYEALLLVAWGSLLAGFGFAKNSKLTLAATTLLSFFVLMTASHSSYDPQLTNLQPVLKSYWLIIHVATLTISYGFLGLGFIMGLMNLFIYLFKTKKDAIRLELLISENTYIIEMNLIIGLMLATIGTFLGAVWANESWGRYWGWDAKETWALIIVVTYSLVIHMRFIPKFNGKFAFNVASVLAFSSVLMTFIGVNYYLSKGMHSYGAGDTPIFPLWAWGTILAIFVLILSAGIKEKNKQTK
jgi:cytochrome c-type biogenesis protein CcsB